MRWLVLILLVACTTEPKSWKIWYSELESCSGRPGNFNRIRWSVVDSISDYYGYWTPPHYISIRSDAVSDEHKVKHEEMHDLLQRGDHPLEYFNGKCGDLLP